MKNNYDIFIKKLYDLSKKCVDRDGSQAFDSIVSIRQYEFLYRLCDQYCVGGSSVLDWGSGSGHFSLFLAHKGLLPTAYGFNFPEFIKEEVEADNIKFVQGPSDEPKVLPFSSSEFSSVFSVGVLEHVREFGGTESSSLLEIHRILKPNGIFICCHLPNRNSWIEFICRSLGFWSHLYRYNEKEVHQLFDRKKWDVLEINRYGFLPRNSIGKLFPDTLKNSILVANSFDFLDGILSKFLNKYSQNWLIIARKI